MLQIVLRPQSAFDVSGDRVATQRDAFVLLFVYATGLRNTELAATTTGGLTRPALDDAWSLLVTATGRRACTVPMPRRLIDELRAQLPHAPGAAHARDGTGRHPADRASHDQRGAAPGRGRLFKGIFARVTDRLASTNPNAAADLNRASTHWPRQPLRTTRWTAAPDIRDMQELLGHARLGTTARYTKADAARQYQVVEAFFYAVLDGSDALATQAASVPIARSAAAPAPANARSATNNCRPTWRDNRKRGTKHRFILFKKQ
ncbi:tyrosine-type recombinase/integrase [Burkholderia ubonensis]|uniref:tyrosine-type recombinase/integrase n=1 Tax=Burkholderia ubonensis TaxID=101571 RepID=UPI0009B31E8E|nr:tyrosine-type recombinase/integrase [Burkholderia ubonensis]